MAAKHPGVVYGRRVAIVDGLRTPFVKSGTDFKDLSALDLATGVVAELLQRSGVGGDQIDQVVYGAVVTDVAGPNIAREIVLAGDMPDTVDAFSVSRACATSTQAVVSGAQSILLGDAEIVVAGGADSLSKPPILYSDRFVDVLMDANAAKDIPGKMKAFSALRPKDLAPQPPAIAERSTGLTMGGSAEIMAKENGISREAQDEYAIRFTPQGRGRLGERHLRRRGHAVPGRPRLPNDRHERQPPSRGFEPRASSPSSARSSTGNTERSRPATRRRSPTEHQP